MDTTTLFEWLPNGQRFKALNGDRLIKRRGTDRRTTFCYECNKVVRLNAIVPGLVMADASRAQFVHFCPADYVVVD